MTSAHRLRSRLRDEEGMVTAFVVIFTFALLLLAGLVIDGGLTLAARVQAIDEAQAAARAGAQAINLPLFRSTGQVVLDPSQARQAAESYLAATGHTGTVRSTATTSRSPCRSPSPCRSWASAESAA